MKSYIKITKNYQVNLNRNLLLGLTFIFIFQSIEIKAQEFLKVYTSAPEVMVSDVTTGGTLFTEDFNSFSIPNSAWAPTPNGYYSADIGTYTQTAGNSSIIADNVYGAGTGDYMAIQVGGKVNLVFDDPVSYFGFAWAAGDGQNNIKLYREGQLIGSFNTQFIINKLPNNPTSKVFAVDNQTEYFTQDFYGKPLVGGNNNQPYAFLHFYTSEGMEFDRIEFIMDQGGAFENDNHTLVVGTPEVTTTWVELIEILTPTANDDSGTGLPGNPIEIDVLDNDTPGDSPIDPTTVQIAGTNNQGSSLVVSGEGTWSVNGTTGAITFTPESGFIGSPTPIEYFVLDDDNYASNLATVTVTYPVGPTALADAAITAINTPVDISILLNDIVGSTTLDAASVNFIVGTEPDPGTEGLFTVDGSGIVTFTPVNNFAGQVTINYEVCDQTPLCSITTITVNVVSGTTNLYPATGFGTLAYEDLWPGKGDYDFNDLVIDYQFEITTTTSNYVESMVGTFVIKAVGATLENGFGFQLASGITPSDLTVSGYSLKENIITLESNGTESGQTIPTIIVFDNAFQEMTHPGTGIGINTTEGAPYVTPITLTINIVFEPDTYTYNDLDISSFNPFIFVNLDRTVEVHLPNYAPTALADQALFGTANDNSDPGSNRYYKTENNLPWAINIYESFDYPKEKQQIVWAYLKFAEWAENNGATFQDWYKDLTGYRNSSLIYTIP